MVIIQSQFGCTNVTDKTFCFSCDTQTFPTKNNLHAHGSCNYNSIAKTTTETTACWLTKTTNCTNTETKTNHDGVSVTK